MQVNEQIPLYSYKDEKAEQQISINPEGLEFVWLVPLVAKADLSDEQDITVLRFYNGEVVTDIAVHFFAGISVLNSDISFYSCFEGDAEYLSRTIQFDRTDNTFKVGPCCKLPYQCT